MADPSVTLFGPIDSLLGPYVEYVVLALVVVNLVTRKIAHDAHVRQARDGGADAISYHPVHWAVTGLLVLATFYYTTLHRHAGVVLSLFVVGMFVADVFEFEARLVEARNDMEIESPKGSLLISVLAFLYAAYVSLFFLVEPLWNKIV
jgi:hypothetical protein